MITDEKRREIVGNIRYRAETCDNVEKPAGPIDRPTCRNNGDRDDRGFVCSACGYEAWTFYDSNCDPSDFPFAPTAERRLSKMIGDEERKRAVTERTCATCADCNGSVRDCCRAKRAGGGKADMGIECPNCGGQIDFHAGHIDNGRVFVCEKGRPPMREVGYHRRHCDSTVISLKKCGPKGVGHDR